MNGKIRVGILGATGSIGTQTLNIIRASRDKFEVCLLSAFSNFSLLKEQILEFTPKISFCQAAPHTHLIEKTKVYNDLAPLNQSETYEGCDIVINGIGGIAGLLPTLAVLDSKAKLATANKESLVSAGSIITEKAKANNKEIIPIDSEHSAIWQCIKGENRVKKLILTASGGAFRNLTKSELKKAKAEQALAHPVWKMGKKVTIDSATMINKALEIIEARWLFDTSDIEVLLHRESIVHGLVEFEDGSIKASLSVPDMHLPIQYALTYPSREDYIKAKRLNLSKVGTLHFEQPDYDRFPCLRFGYDVLKNPNLGAVLVGADEVLVDLYQQNKIGFYDIEEIIQNAFERFSGVKIDKVSDVLSIDNEVKEYTLSRIPLFGGF